MNAIGIFFLLYNLKDFNNIISIDYKGEDFYSYQRKIPKIVIRYQIAYFGLSPKIRNIYNHISLLAVTVLISITCLSNLIMPIKIGLIALNIFLPILILEIGLSKISYSLDSEIIPLLQYLNTSLYQSEDIIKAIKYASAMTNNAYLKLILSQFNQGIISGVDSRRAFSILQMQAFHEYLRYIILNLEQVYQRRGDVVRLISGLEQEYTSIQIEINKRKIELRQDRFIAIGSMIVVLLTALKIIEDHDYIKSYFTLNPVGRIFVWIMIIVFFLATYILLRAIKIDY